MTTFEKIQDIIVAELGQDKDKITMDTTFESLQVDSLDLFQIINEIEDEFDVEIDTEEGLNSVADLVAFVENAQD